MKGLASSGCGELLTLKGAIGACGVPEEGEANAENPVDLVDVVIQDLAQDLTQELAQDLVQEKPYLHDVHTGLPHELIQGNRDTRRGAQLSNVEVREVGCRAEKPPVIKQSRVWARKPVEGRHGAPLVVLPMVSGVDSVKGKGLDSDVQLDQGGTGEGSSADLWQAAGGRHCSRPPASGVVGVQQGLVNSPNRFGSLQGKQDCLVEQGLVTLHREHYSVLGRRIKDARSGLEEAQVRWQQLHSPEAKSVVDGFKKHLAFLLRAEDSVLKQQLKDDWMRLTDRNSKYFFSLLRSKANKASIS
ncbi:hypothetical protein Dimus_027492 [Dionaea muscipula]